ncbi:MAG: DUF1292 domain-containing protein [Phycisphaerales bacterium]|nr:DUF1292 domain-containing protein [Phycisphaerales bacterium]
MTRRSALASVCLVACTSAALAQPVIPNDFELNGGEFGPLFSYFGGVQTFGAEPSTTTIHTGRSLRCWANFRHDSLFRVAGFAVGTLGVTRSSGALGFPTDASVFSITIAAPRPAAPEVYVSGQLRLIVTLREDDNGDGIIDTIEDDDEWETAGIPITTGTNVYNIPLAQFADTDPLAGDGVRNFSTTGLMACLLTFETRTAYPGGIVESPRELLIDHAGLFNSAQSLPARCPADTDRSGTVTLQDLFDYLTQWFAGATGADSNGDGAVVLQDLFDYLSLWFAPCE